MSTFLDHSKSEGVNGNADNGGGGAASTTSQGPVYFVGLARLHLTNLPNAADLSAHHAYHEFAVRLGQDKRVYFCDQRIANVFNNTVSSTDSMTLQKSLLGEPFTDLIVREDELSRFSTLFEQGTAFLLMSLFLQGSSQNSTKDYCLMNSHFQMR